MTAQLYLQIVYVLVWHTLTTSVATGSFTSTPAHVDGVLKACVGDQISLTCSHDDSMSNGITRWLFSSPVDCAFLIDHFQPNNAQPCGPFTLRGVSETTGGMVLNSSVVVAAITLISGTIAECRDASGNSYNEIGRTSICVIDQPTNLTVVDGTWISWIGSVCAGTDTTYRVVVTFVSDSQPTCTCTRDPIETSNTTTVLSGLLPNQQYSVSVSAYGTSCVSDPATVNFTSPAHHSTTTESQFKTTTGQLPEQTTEECDGTSEREVGLAVGVGIGVGLPFQVIIIAVTVIVTLIINNYCLRHYCNGQLDGTENDDRGRVEPVSQEERRVSPHETLQLPTDRQDQKYESAFYEEIVPTDSSTIDLHNNDAYSVV